MEVIHEEVYQKLRDFASKCNFTVVTATQARRPEGYITHTPKVESDIIFIDYLDILK